MRWRQQHESRAGTRHSIAPRVGVEPLQHGAPPTTQTLVCIVRVYVRTFPAQLSLAQAEPKATCPLTVTVTSAALPTGAFTTLTMSKGRANGGTSIDCVYVPGTMGAVLRMASIHWRAGLEATEEVSATAPAEIVPTRSPVIPRRVIERSDRAIITSSVCVPDSRQRLHIRYFAPLCSRRRHRSPEKIKKEGFGNRSALFGGSADRNGLRPWNFAGPGLLRGCLYRRFYASPW